MPCIDTVLPESAPAPGGAPPLASGAVVRLLGWGLTAGLVASLSGCGSPPAPPAAQGAGASRPLPNDAAQRAAPPQANARTAAPARRPARHWDEYRVHAAERLVAANQTHSYTGAVPEPLLAIPVLEIEVNGDGTVRKVSVQRRPSQALDTVQLAIDAVHRAAPFPPVAHLPKPWKFTETFLFDEQRRFKPRSLD